LRKIVAPLELECFRTSIWDETLYRAWSAIVHSLVPNKRLIENGLLNLCKMCDADEIVLFEKATFLVISHAQVHEHGDVHRFEKISNIVKQFKLSCGNAHSQFVSMEVRNASFSAFIDAFTPTTHIMVVMSDPKISKTLLNFNFSFQFQKIPRQL
jgi:Ras-related GTP-binding protein A/B